MKKIVLGVITFVVVVIVGLGASYLIQPKEKYTTIYGAIGGGKEAFLADPEVQQILKEQYQLVIQPDAWSNGKLIKDPLIREDGKKYDFVFFSDERFYEYYKKPASNDEAPREKVLNSAIALSTPIVIYSWDTICDQLIQQGIVQLKDNVYYIMDMPGLLKYIENNTKWSDIGVDNIFGKINISSTDPVTSSPGATYYGLLASVMNEGYVDKSNIQNVLPQLKTFYKTSGFLNNTPADLFDLYLRMGKGAYPLVVDYEKSIIEFASSNPAGYDKVKDKIRILYPNPTIWNSHCIMSFTDNGSKYMEALFDPKIQKIAWEKYGFRTGVVGGEYSVEGISVPHIPQEISFVTPGLQKEIYDEIIAALKSN